MSETDIEFAPELPPLVALRFERLEAFAAVEEPGAEALVTNRDKLGAYLAVGSTVVYYGDGGAGKTTILARLALHFATGLAWCGFQVSDGRYVRVDRERRPAPDDARQIPAKHEAWQGPKPDARIHVLDEPWSRFTFRKPTTSAADRRARRLD